VKGVFKKVKTNAARSGNPAFWHCRSHARHTDARESHTRARTPAQRLHFFSSVFDIHNFCGGAARKKREIINLPTQNWPQLHCKFNNNLAPHRCEFVFNQKFSIIARNRCFCPIKKYVKVKKGKNSLWEQQQQKAGAAEEEEEAAADKN